MAVARHAQRHKSTNEDTELFYSILTKRAGRRGADCIIIIIIINIFYIIFSAFRVGRWRCVLYVCGGLWSMELGQNCYRVSTGFHRARRWFKSSRWTFNGFSAVLYSHRPRPRNLLPRTICPDTFLIRRTRMDVARRRADGEGVRKRGRVSERLREIAWEDGRSARNIGGNTPTRSYSFDEKGFQIIDGGSSAANRNVGPLCVCTCIYIYIYII